MQPERWQNCIAIFDAAIERPHSARATFLERRCNGDTALRQQVELLLKYHEQQLLKA